MSPSFLARPAALLVLSAVAILLFVQTPKGIHAFQALQINLGNVNLNKYLWSGEQATDRSQDWLKQAATHYGLAANSQPQITTTCECGTSCAAIALNLMAIRYRQDRDFMTAAQWFQVIANSNLQQYYEPVMLPQDIIPTERGDLFITWDKTRWGIRSDSHPKNASVSIDPSTQHLTLSYKNRLDERDSVGYAWGGPLELPYWHTVRLVAKIHPGSTLILETVTENGSTRHVSYYGGTGDWEEFLLPLDGNQLRFLYILLSERSAQVTTPEHKVEIQPVVLLIDEGGEECNP
jgi:hypothetical protein